MAEFVKYTHIERFGGDETEGILEGKVWASIKYDGANGSVWLGEDGQVKCASRNQVLSVENTNRGFYTHVQECERYARYFQSYPHHVLYGEWLVKHTIEYPKEMYGRFYVFDIWDSKIGCWLLPPALTNVRHWDLDFIPHHAFTDPTIEEIKAYLNVSPSDEGFVLKNYEFKNKYGRCTFAKVITWDKPVLVKQLRDSNTVEEKFAKELPEHLCRKVYANLPEGVAGTGPGIQRYLSTVYHDFVTEELWALLGKYKNPVVDFRKLKSAVEAQAKVLVPEVLAR